MEEKKKTDRFRGDQWYYRKIKKRTRDALKAQNLQFEQENRTASDEELLQYVKACAQKLNKLPCQSEVIGGQYIAERMGGWNKVLEHMELSLPRRNCHYDKQKVYLEEYARQRRSFREERAQKKDLKQQASAARKQKKEKRKQELQERDQLWWEQNKQKTDEELLQYIRDKAEELGHTPFGREVPGSSMIAKRFGTWPQALETAGLVLPDVMKKTK